MRSYTYDDDYATCGKTYATLRILSDEIEPEKVTAHLEIQPTNSFRKGDLFGRKRLPSEFNGWFFSTEDRIRSRDTRRHIDEILRVVKDKKEAIDWLISSGCRVDITNYWASIGFGGPMLEHEQMTRLGEMKISIGWDVVC